MNKPSPAIIAPAASGTDLGALFVSLELSRSRWSSCRCRPAVPEKMSKRSVPGGGPSGLMARFRLPGAKARARMGRDFLIVTIREAGLDGFWIHRAPVSALPAFRRGGLRWCTPQVWPRLPVNPGRARHGRPRKRRPPHSRGDRSAGSIASRSNSSSRSAASWIGSRRMSASLLLGATPEGRSWRRSSCALSISLSISALVSRERPRNPRAHPRSWRCAAASFRQSGTAVRSSCPASHDRNTCRGGPPRETGQ